MAARDCPMCGETMRLRTREVVDRVPGIDPGSGGAQTKTRRFSEWVCAECDYFEEADEMAG